MGRALGICLLLLVFLNGCNTTRIAENPRPVAAQASAHLRAGDSLNINLQGIPDAAAHQVQVDEDGMITLPFLGTVSAAGKTSSQLSQSIRALYVEHRIYTSIDVSVAVTERYIYVGGEVARPGRIVWTPDLTLTKAIQAAGGFSLYARENRVILVRDQATYELSAPLAQRNPAEDPLLFPGDSIQVPRSAF